MKIKERGEDGGTLRKNKKNETKVAGALKNVISSERMFLKSYIQLWWEPKAIELLEAMFLHMIGHVS